MDDFALFSLGFLHFWPRESSKGCFGKRPPADETGGTYRERTPKSLRFVWGKMFQNNYVSLAYSFSRELEAYFRVAFAAAGPAPRIPGHAFCCFCAPPLWTQMRTLLVVPPLLGNNRSLQETYIGYGGGPTPSSPDYKKPTTTYHKLTETYKKHTDTYQKPTQNLQKPTRNLQESHRNLQ